MTGWSGTQRLFSSLQRVCTQIRGRETPLHTWKYQVFFFFFYPNIKEVNGRGLYAAGGATIKDNQFHCPAWVKQRFTLMTLGSTHIKLQYKCLPMVLILSLNS